MPRENKKRGRRAETQKRKADDAAIDDAKDVPDSKKRRVSIDEPVPGEPNLSAALPAHHVPEVEFYGMLDDDEQEYFRRADDMLEVNAFQDAEERILFLENVHKEAVGKELKLACSQSCSRLLERLILLSTPAQLKALFQKLNGQCVVLSCFPIRLSISLTQAAQLPQPCTAPLRFSCL